MGTWGHGIYENDTSFDVKETFFEKYNAGMEPESIYKDILVQFTDSLNDNEDADNVLFPLAQCLWDVCALNNELLAEVQENIQQGNNINVCHKLGANENFLKKRRATLDKLLVKISTPKDKPKQRKKPPQRIESPLYTGSCLAFQYPDGSFGGAIVIEAEFFNTKGSIYLALTNIRSQKQPVFEDFKSAKLMDFEWERVDGQAKRQAAKKMDDVFYTGRVHRHSLNYDNKQAREAFANDLTGLFLMVGKLPKFTQILYATTWIDDIASAPAILDYYYHLPDRKISELALGELAGLLSVRTK